MNFPRRRGGSHVTNHPPHVTRGERRSAALPNLRRGGGFFGHDPPTSLFLTRPAVSPHRMATARRGPHDLEQRPQRVHLRRHQPTTEPYTTYQLPPIIRDRAIDARSSMGRGGEATYGHDGPGRTRAQRVSRGRVPPRRDPTGCNDARPVPQKMGMPPRLTGRQVETVRVEGERAPHHKGWRDAGTR